MGADPCHDIVIVGYGPVAAFAAMLLADAGLRVAILEKSREPVVLPRAVGLDGESVRAFQRLGFGDEVAAILQPPRQVDEVSFTNSKRERLFGMTIPAHGANGWRDVSFFDQPELEALLREHVAALDGVDVFFGHEVDGLEQSADEVVVRSRSDNGTRTAHRAAYVLGCDGASSFVRGAVGIDWQSLGYDQDWLVVDIVQGPDANLPLSTMQVCDPARLATYVCVKDPYRRWEFQLLDGETREEMLRPEKIRELLAPWVAPEHYAIRRKAVYQFHAANADQWRVGRVFLAGDSAHQTPPFLGQGLNAGFRDAVNLGWKIPLVLAGTCDEALLDTYGAERDAHARDLVEWAVDIGRLMETLAAREAGQPDPYPRTDQSAGYGQGRSVPPLRQGILVDAQLGESSPVGGLLRQPTVRRVDGAETRLDELLGPGFAIVGREPGDLIISDSARPTVARLGIRSIALSGLAVARGQMDNLFKSHRAVVIRPDRYVFGVVTEEWSLDRLIEELGRKTALHVM
jgi:2-polyprenyl-6-methoxyphenol hydroxylase-like FAD-dependent oxidoreductase